jgi:ligand-binding SRPBCC domain-containing protein
MPIIEVKTIINAPIERVFDLARCIDLHQESMLKHKERAIAGKMKGLIEKDESVTWEARHFWIKQQLTSKITVYQRPHHFRDTMIKGAFQRFDHDHFFEQKGVQTVMKDVFDYDSPLGMLGKVADSLFLKKYMTDLLKSRNVLIKTAAESESWKQFLA